MVKQLNIAMDDWEFKKVKRIKELSGASSWKTWILDLIKISEMENKK